MSFFSEAELRFLGEEVLRKSTTNTASLVLKSETRSAKDSDRFDIFLCHSKIDEKIILGLKRKLEEAGNKVYVDWIDDPQSRESAITVENAEMLRKRMKQCDTLLYAHSTNSIFSKWMPWELGYFDSLKGKIAIVQKERSLLYRLKRPPESLKGKNI